MSDIEYESIEMMNGAKPDPNFPAPENDYAVIGGPLYDELSGPVKPLAAATALGVGAVAGAGAGAAAGTASLAPSEDNGKSSSNKKMMALILGAALLILLVGGAVGMGVFFGLEGGGTSGNGSGEAAGAGTDNRDIVGGGGSESIEESDDSVSERCEDTNTCEYSLRPAAEPFPNGGNEDCGYEHMEYFCDYADPAVCGGEKPTDDPVFARTEKCAWYSKECSCQGTPTDYACRATSGITQATVAKTLCSAKQQPTSCTPPSGCGPSCVATKTCPWSFEGKTTSITGGPGCGIVESDVCLEGDTACDNSFNQRVDNKSCQVSRTCTCNNVYRNVCSASGQRAVANEYLMDVCEIKAGETTTPCVPTNCVLTTFEYPNDVDGCGKRYAQPRRTCNGGTIGGELTKTCSNTPGTIPSLENNECVASSVCSKGRCVTQCKYPSGSLTPGGESYCSGKFVSCPITCQLSPPIK
jgi:hypothetical protein